MNDLTNFQFNRVAGLVKAVNADPKNGALRLRLKLAQRRLFRLICAAKGRRVSAHINAPW